MTTINATAKEFGLGQVVESIKCKLPRMYSLPSSKHCSIFHVPKVLLRHNVSAYEPVLVSIGPYHHGKEGLEAMEALKLLYLYKLLNQSRRTLAKHITLEKLVSGVMQLAPRAYNYYEESLTIEMDKFIEMMVIDGCFIIELLLKFIGKMKPDTTDPIFNKPCILDNIRRDLILLENQIPWYLLEVMYMDLVPQDGDQLFSLDLLNHSLSLFHHILPIKLNLQKFTQKTFQVEPKHLLDLLYCTIVYSTPTEDSSLIIISKDTDDTNENSVSNSWEPTPCVKDLSITGVSFQKGSESNILSIEFENGVVKIPTLLVYKHSECLFLNLVALEQSHYDYQDKIASYILLLNNLIKTTSDVLMLCDGGIIDNWLGNEGDVANLFRNLVRDVCVKNFFYFGLSQNVKKYANIRKQWWLSKFMPWKILFYLNCN